MLEQEGPQAQAGTARCGACCAEAAPHHAPAAFTPQHLRKPQARLRTDTRGWACSHARADSSSTSRDVPTCSGCSPLRPSPGREGFMLQANCSAKRPSAALGVAELVSIMSMLVYEVIANT